MPMLWAGFRARAHHVYAAEQSFVVRLRQAAWSTLREEVGTALERAA